jgi:uncharacterized protein
MIDPTFPWHRFAMIVALAERVPTGLKHTALVKYAYLLQALRRVPLGYRFTLYAYGPFDAGILDDMTYAQVLDAVKVKTVDYPNGYSYNIRPGRAATEIKAKARDFLAEYEDAIEWVIGEFGNLSAAQLELVSTMIFADREAMRSNESLSLQELTNRVREVKPRFSVQEVYAQAESLRDKGLLRTIQS